MRQNPDSAKPRVSFMLSISRSERPHIVLVEDDDAVRRSLHLLLAANGYDVMAFPSSAGVPNEPQALRADCLVVDLMIPDGDGLGLLQEMRSAGWSGAAILISGHLTDDLAARAIDEGYALALPKPIGDSVLVNAIGRLLGNHVAPGGSAEKEA
jgi:FixJ family two-component response regulator